jgi:hypothetical protein
MHFHNLSYPFYKILDLRMGIVCARTEATENYVKTAYVTIHICTNKNHFSVKLLLRILYMSIIILMCLCQNIIQQASLEFCLMDLWIISVWTGISSLSYDQFLIIQRHTSMRCNIRCNKVKNICQIKILNWHSSLSNKFTIRQKMLEHLGDFLNTHYRNVLSAICFLILTSNLFSSYFKCLNLVNSEVHLINITWLGNIFIQNLL